MKVHQALNISFTARPVTQGPFDVLSSKMIGKRYWVIECVLIVACFGQYSIVSDKETFGLAIGRFSLHNVTVLY